MSVDVETRTVIKRPVDVVARFASDPTNAPKWYKNIARVEWRTEPPMQVGSILAFEARFLGRTLRYDYEIVEHVPGERLVMRTSQGPFPMQTTYTWRSLGPDSTEMTLRNNGDPAGFSRVVTPMLAGAMRRANRKDLAKLKHVLQAQRG